MPRLILFVLCIAFLLAGGGFVRAGMALGASAIGMLVLYALWLLLQMFLAQPPQRPRQ